MDDKQKDILNLAGKDGANDASLYVLDVVHNFKDSVSTTLTDIYSKIPNVSDIIDSIVVPKGDTGDKGDKGDRGEKGAPGIEGKQGKQGIQGLQGQKGDRGEKGDQGEKGDSGTNGKDGRNIVGWGAHPINIKQSGTVKTKNARSINFTGATVTQSLDGVTTVAIDAGSYTDEQAQDAVGTILTDSSEIDFTYNDGVPSITATIIPGSIDETKLDVSTNASLDLADSASQPGHTHLLVAGATDVTMTATNLNILDDGLNTTLHFHDADRARGVHTGTQLSTTISDFTEASQDATGAMVDTSLVYVDSTPLLTRAALTGAITAAQGSNTTLLGSFTTTQLNTALSDADVATGGGTATGANTGDNAVNTLYSGLVSNATHTGDATGATALTVVALNGTNLAGLATGVLKNTISTGVPFISKVAITEPATAATLTIANNQTLTVNGSATITNGTHSGTNTGDQTSIVGITGTLAQFNTAVSDAELARTDAANTFTGIQTFSTPIATGSVATMSATVGGGVPTPPNNTTTFLRGDGTFATPTASATITTQDEGTPLSSTVTTLNFTGAGVTASGAGATTTINIPGGAGSFAVTETEVDFGTTPVTGATFTVTDASITGTSKIMVTESGSTATGRVASGDSLWDTITYSCVPAAGTFTLYARASGAVVGYRKLFYTYS